MRGIAWSKESCLWRAKPLSIFGGTKEPFDHFSLHKVSAELIKLVKPKTEPTEVAVNFGRIVRIVVKVGNDGAPARKLSASGRLNYD